MMLTIPPLLTLHDGGDGARCRYGDPGSPGARRTVCRAVGHHRAAQRPHHSTAVSRSSRRSVTAPRPPQRFPITTATCTPRVSPHSSSGLVSRRPPSSATWSATSRSRWSAAIRWPPARSRSAASRPSSSTSASSTSHADPGGRYVQHPAIRGWPAPSGFSASSTNPRRSRMPLCACHRSAKPRGRVSSGTSGSATPRGHCR